MTDKKNRYNDHTCKYDPCDCYYRGPMGPRGMPGPRGQ